MTDKIDYNDGNIHGWNGGDCPVHPKSIVLVWTDEGAAGAHMGWPASTYGWSGDNDVPIRAFKVIKVYEEPKSLWACETEKGSVAQVFYIKEDAQTYASFLRGHIRVVEYREVKE